jgi:hypothetical protein
MCKDSVAWLYRLERSESWESGVTVPGDYFFKDKKGRVRLIVERSGRLTVTRGYAWNGCSPKFCLFDIVLGTPDGVVHRETGRPKAYFASLFHDALYQFLPEECPYTRRQADEMFLRLLAQSGFAPRRLYWAAVRLFGGLTRPVTAKRRRHSGSLWSPPED